MKTVVFCLVVLLGVGGWQGFTVYNDKISTYETLLAAKNDQVSSLKLQRDDFQKQASELQDKNTVLQSKLDQIQSELTAANDVIQSKETAPSNAATPVPAPSTFNPPATIPSQPNWNWTTTDGKVYKNVVITKIDPDCVTIIHDDGGALVPISKLPPDIQKLCNYDPAAAKAAADKRAQDDKDSLAAIDAERQKKVAELAADDSWNAKIKAGMSNEQIQDDIKRINARLSQIDYEKQMASASGARISAEQTHIYQEEQVQLKWQLKADQAALSQLAVH